MRQKQRQREWGKKVCAHYKMLLFKMLLLLLVRVVIGCHSILLTAVAQEVCAVTLKSTAQVMTHVHTCQYHVTQWILAFF